MQPTPCRLTYQGDAALALLLGKAGARFDVEGVRELIRGVLGAPPGRDAAEWCLLVAADSSPALVAQLQALKAEIAGAETAKIPPPVAERLAALRVRLAEIGIDGFIVPHADEYQNEYLPECNERLRFLTGFTGSAGCAIVLADRAALFVDGRYTLQARAETDAALFEPHHLIEDPPEAWIEHALTAGQVLGYDPFLLTPAQLDRFRDTAVKAGAALRPVEPNPLDVVWAPVRPAAPLGLVQPHPLAFAGKSAADKRQEIAGRLRDARSDAVVMTAPDSIAWLLNLRGGDVAHTPLPLGRALLDSDGQVELFIDRRKLAPGLDLHLGNQVTLRDPEEFGPILAALAGKSVQFDPMTAPVWLADFLAASGAKPVRAADPIAVPKAVKNQVELEGARAAHRRDGAAMVRFLHWLDGAVPAGRLREIEVADRLEAFRQEGEHYRDLSFASISGAGPNGAIIHYHATAESERRLEPGSLYLIDSGAQYLDGTTDITRTIAIGRPTDEMKDRYTRVLKGHIALATATFPLGTTGPQLDVLARLPLWQAGVTYDHGTGHGVGSYLGVHEGPARISAAPNAQKLLPGMILSNEPGYYKEGGFGVRIENLVVVIEVEIAGAERDMLGFETLTLCPIDLRPLEKALLTDAEIAWLDAYHARVRAALTGLLADPAERAWLDEATRALP